VEAHVAPVFSSSAASLLAADVPNPLHPPNRIEAAKPSASWWGTIDAKGNQIIPAGKIALTRRPSARWRYRLRNRIDNQSLHLFVLGDMIERARSNPAIPWQNICPPA